MNAVAENWDNILEIMKRDYDISEIQCNTWLKPLKVVSYKDGVVTISLPSQLEGLGQKFISNKYTLPLLAMLLINYWCNTKEEKEELINKYFENEQKYQEQLREKYNPDFLFNKNNAQ